MEKKYCDALKKLARQAKNRLSGRNYIEGNGCKVYKGGLLADYKLIQLNKQEDELLYNKVRQILSEDIDTINPIGKLADEEKIQGMSAQEKERYVFNLIDKYIKMKARFERERNEQIEFVG